MERKVSDVGHASYTILHWSWTGTANGTHWASLRIESVLSVKVVTHLAGAFFIRLYEPCDHRRTLRISRATNAALTVTYDPMGNSTQGATDDIVAEIEYTVGMPDTHIRHVNATNHYLLLAVVSSSQYTPSSWISVVPIEISWEGTGWCCGYWKTLICLVWVYTHTHWDHSVYRYSYGYKRNVSTVYPWSTLLIWVVL